MSVVVKNLFLIISDIQAKRSLLLNCFIVVQFEQRKLTRQSCDVSCVFKHLLITTWLLCIFSITQAPSPVGHTVNLNGNVLKGFCLLWIDVLSKMVTDRGIVSHYILVRQNQIHLKVCAALIVFTMYYKDGAKQFSYRNSALWSGFWFHYLSRWYDKFKLKIASFIFDRKETSDCKKSKPSCLFFWRASS